MKKLSCLFFIALFVSFAYSQPYTIQQYLNLKSAGSPTLFAGREANGISDKCYRHVAGLGYGSAGRNAKAANEL